MNVLTKLKSLGFRESRLSEKSPTVAEIGLAIAQGLTDQEIGRRFAPKRRKRKPRVSDDELRAAVAEGLTNRQIAERFGYGLDSARTRLRRMGLAARREYVLGEEARSKRAAQRERGAEPIRRLAAKGLYSVQIARKMGLSRERVRQIVKANRIDVPRGNRSAAIEAKNRAAVLSLGDRVGEMTDAEIAAKTGLSITTARRHRRALGLKSRGVRTPGRRKVTLRQGRNAGLLVYGAHLAGIGAERGDYVTLTLGEHSGKPALIITKADANDPR